MGITFGKPLTPFEPPAPPVASAADVADPAPSAQVGMAQTGTGQLQGLQISVPSASIRPETADPTSLPQAVQSAAQSAQLQPAAALQAAVPLAPQPKPAIDLSSLCVPLPGSLATNPAVLDALHDHALAAGTSISRGLIQNYVALGERVVRAIEQTEAQEIDTPSPLEPAIALDAALEAVDVTGQRLQRLTLTTPQGRVQVTPNQEVARALSWYVVACAAQQDVNQKATGVAREIDGKAVSDLSISGSYMFKDPGHAIYRFMQSSPLAYSRISTHFNELSTSSKDSWGNADQRGIEDYDRQLPGQNGTILFDRLKDGQDQALMFVKFESEGVPLAWIGAQPIDDMGNGSASAFTAWMRVLAHSLSFVATRLGSPPGVERKEHVYKGILEPTVHQPFMEVFRAAERLGILGPGMNSKHYAQLSKEHGFPLIESSLAALKAMLDESQESSPELTQLREKLVETEESVRQNKAQLGAQSDALGIVRRGAETHVDLNPPRAHLQQAQDDLLNFAAGPAQARDDIESSPLSNAAGAHTTPAGVHLETAQDWDLHGIEINGQAYGGRGKEGGGASSLEQACSAFVQACGGNVVASDWISRFAQQRLAEPLLNYLKKESLGSVGEGIDLSAGVRTLKVNTLPPGAVEVVLDFRYENRQEARSDVKNVLTGETLEMSENARLQASVTLRFENLASFTAAQAPVPLISKPLTYSTSEFHEKPGSGFVLVSESDANSDSDSESE